VVTRALGLRPVWWQAWRYERDDPNRNSIATRVLEALLLSLPFVPTGATVPQLVLSQGLIPGGHSGRQAAENIRPVPWLLSSPTSRPLSEAGTGTFPRPEVQRPVVILLLLAMITADRLGHIPEIVLCVLALLMVLVLVCAAARRRNSWRR